MLSRCHGDVSNRYAPAVGRSLMSWMRFPVVMVPPSSCSFAASVSEMRREPPRGIGQPTAWPVTRNTIAKPAVKGWLSGRNECAATPATRARARSPWSDRVRTPAEKRARSPKQAKRRGSRGAWIAGRITSAKSRSQRSTYGETRRRYASPSAPRPTAVSSMDRSSTTAVPSSSGCAGSIHSSPSSSRRSVLKKGDAFAIGWIAEQTSCTKPGSVSSAERAPPPISSFASYTATEWPARAIWMAAARPFGPAPTTTASGTQQVAVEPLARATDRVDHVLARAEAVSLALVYVVFVHLVGGAQRGDDLLGLRQRHARIVLALQDEERRIDLR